MIKYKNIILDTATASIYYIDDAGDIGIMPASIEPFILVRDDPEARKLIFDAIFNDWHGEVWRGWYVTVQPKKYSDISETYYYDNEPTEHEVKERYHWSDKDDLVVYIEYGVYLR